MSLVTELMDPRSELTRWCEWRFPGTAEVVAEIQEATRGARPLLPHGTVSREHWSEVGAALGQRLADFVQPAPPYYALLGMVRAGWVDAAWAHDQAARYPTHRDLPDDARRRALEIRPVVDGWLDIESGLRGARSGPAGVARALADQLRYGREYLAEHVRTGTVGRAAVERELACCALLLAGCEQTYRIGAPARGLADAVQVGGERLTRAGLRQGVDEDQAEEVAELVALLEVRGVLAQLHTLAGNPTWGYALGIAGPSIVSNWAEADLLVGAVDERTAAGTTLVEVKAMGTVKHADRIARSLRQAVCYALLDSADVYAIRHVALLLARHGVLLTWPLDELLARLGGGAGRVEVMSTFAPVAGRAIWASGWRPPPRR